MKMYGQKENQENCRIELRMSESDAKFGTLLSLLAIKYFWTKVSSSRKHYSFPKNNSSYGLGPFSSKAVNDGQVYVSSCSTTMKKYWTVF